MSLVASPGDADSRSAPWIVVEMTAFVADKSPYKQGKLMPGVHLPVVGPERVLADKPDYTLVLAWNFYEEIRRQLDAYYRAGGRFVLPVPEPKVMP